MPKWKRIPKSIVSKVIVRALDGSIDHWDEILDIHMPQDKGLEFFDEHCRGDKCPLCEVAKLCTACPMIDGSNACFFEWGLAAEAASENRLTRGHLEAVRNKLVKMRKLCVAT